MIAKLSRRDLLHAGCITAGALGVFYFADGLGAASSAVQNKRAGNAGNDAATKPADGPVELFYRDDWLGEPWVKPDPVIMIHGNHESGVAWYGWVPRRGQHFRLLRPDLPGLGQSPIPPKFEWSISSLA